MARSRTRILLLALLLGLCACGMEPFDAPRSQEIPQGPGLFTGRSGAFTISAPSLEERKTPAQSQGATSSDNTTSGKR